MINLKSRLQQPEILLAPGVYDALSALMAEQAGFEAVYFWCLGGIYDAWAF